MLCLLKENTAHPFEWGHTIWPHNAAALLLPKALIVEVEILKDGYILENSHVHLHTCGRMQVGPHWALPPITRVSTVHPWRLKILCHQRFNGIFTMVCNECLRPNICWLCSRDDVNTGGWHKITAVFISFLEKSIWANEEGITLVYSWSVLLVFPSAFVCKVVC